MKYKIEQKDFDKLSQLDRIEYRQSKNEIDESYSLGSLFDSFFWGIWLTSLIIGVTGYIMNDSSFNIVSNFIFKVLFIYLIFGLGLKILSFYKKAKATEELNKKYFTVSLSPKKRK